MQLDVVNMDGKKVGQIDVSDAVFSAPVRQHLLWEVVNAQRAAWRAGTHATKTRESVRGGGRKPYRQKGTGNARQGSTRAPQFVGGGKVFGPHPRKYSYTVPRKVRKAALAAALSLRAKERKLVIVDTFALEKPRTKRMDGVFRALGLESALLVDAKGNVNLFKSVRNIPSAKCLAPEGLNVYDVLNHKALVIARAAIEAVQARIVAEQPEAA